MKFLIVLFAALALCSGAPNTRVVQGWVDCGSRGTIQQLGVTDCTQVPCQLAPGKIYDIEVDFTSSIRITQIRLQISVITADGLIPLYDLSVQGNIYPNEPSNLSLGFPVTDLFSGQHIELQFELGDYNSGERELCLSATADVA